MLDDLRQVQTHQGKLEVKANSQYEIKPQAAATQPQRAAH